jgi:hypothetical protein
VSTRLFGPFPSGDASPVDASFIPWVEIMGRPCASLGKAMKNFALLPASQEIREWCSLLEQEMMHWPGVKKSHIFGTRAFYHRKVMFAMLPDKRTLDSSTAISFITSSKDDKNQLPNWQTFELKDRNLIKTALTSLEKAYKESMLRSSMDGPSFIRQRLSSTPQ